MSAELPRMLMYRGMPCRLAGRRPDGKVLIEWLRPSTHEPLGTWTATTMPMLRQANNAKAPPSHWEQLIQVLPEVTFVTDRAPPSAPVRADEPVPAGETLQPWWNRDD